MIIAASHRQICWGRERNDQSEVFKNPHNSTQNACGKYWYRHIFLNFSKNWHRSRYFWQHYRRQYFSFIHFLKKNLFLWKSLSELNCKSCFVFCFFSNFTILYVILVISLPHSYGINFICAGLKRGWCEMEKWVCSGHLLASSVDSFFFLLYFFFYFLTREKRKRKPDRQTKGHQAKSSQINRSAQHHVKQKRGIKKKEKGKNKWK